MRNDQVSGVFGGSPPKDTAPLSTTNDCFIGWRRRHYFTSSRRSQRPGCSCEFRISVDFPYFVIHFRFPPSLPVYLLWRLLHGLACAWPVYQPSWWLCCDVGIMVGAVGGAGGCLSSNLSVAAAPPLTSPFATLTQLFCPTPKPLPPPCVRDVCVGILI